MASIIEVQNLSKSYIISHEEKEKYTTLRDVVSKKAKKILSYSNNHSIGTKPTREEFWALNDINFVIERGDRVGIIGRNGAGKSTLLKILSRITEPTKGSIKIKGRIASLLEVGTGFHPELTGRENIFLNGAILGMSRAEIKRHFDAIVDFAEVDKFLDTPVKRYSSGMYVRLAFAIAAHLEPEILIVDEVLAVGDAQFQKKCLGKMEDVSKNEGRTVLFVSHNMAAVNTLCTKGIYLKNGQIEKMGNISKVILQYLNTSQVIENDGIIPESLSTFNTGVVKFVKFKFDSISAAENIVYYSSDIKLSMEISSEKEISNIMLDVRITDDDRKEIVHSSNVYQNGTDQFLRSGINNFNVVIKNYLQPGSYSLTIGIHESNGTTLEYIENIVTFEVLSIGESGTEDHKFSYKAGMVRFDSTWTRC